ncbi:MAG: hypothetical protein WCR80_06945 [Bacilli bacterium]
MSEQEKLMSDIRQALQKMRYKSATTGFDRTLAPHQLEAIMDTLTPVTDSFFENNTVQSGKVRWDDNI